MAQAPWPWAMMPVDPGPFIPDPHARKLITKVDPGPWFIPDFSTRNDPPDVKAQLPSPNSVGPFGSLGTAKCLKCRARSRRCVFPVSSSPNSLCVTVPQPDFGCKVHNGGAIARMQTSTPNFYASTIHMIALGILPKSKKLTLRWNDRNRYTARRLEVCPEAKGWSACPHCRIFAHGVYVGRSYGNSPIDGI